MFTKFFVIILFEHVTFFMALHFACSENPIILSGLHILIRGKSEERAILTARNVLPEPTGPRIAWKYKYMYNNKVDNKEIVSASNEVLLCDILRYMDTTRHSYS